VSFVSLLNRRNQARAGLDEAWLLTAIFTAVELHGPRIGIVVT